ncbi:sugar transporter ERD6-like 5 isoform X4 [Punica granatum]|uniref:Sugar transporter ERD6-like 5 isoform X4 n=1 Tax=Punica granatum TaxID=22663 RepID=A0A6P8C0Y6_PUNGR|nr:sugar transporter ERD6-like 5 isoform X4 [Punica granatum]
MLTMACGVSIMFIIGPVLYWRLLALIGMAPCLLQLLGLFFVPESPRWLANMGRRKEAEGALQRLWGRNADISKEAAEIEVGVGLMVVQQFSGLNGHVYYLSSILEKAGASATAGSTTHAIIQLIVIILAIFLMDKFGRQPLLLVAVLGSCFGNILTGFSFLLQVRHNRSCNVVDTWFLVFVCQIFRPRFQCDMQDLHRWSNAIPTLAFLGVWWILFARPGRDTMGYDVRDISCKPDGLSQQHRELGQLGRFMGRGVYLQWFLPVELSRRVFLLCECLLVRDNLCCENGTGNEGANNGRRTSFYEPVTLTRQIVNYLHDLLQW